MTLEEIVEERRTRSCRKKLRIWFRYRLPRILFHEWPGKPRELIWFWQRGHRGWSNVDVVDIYGYLTPIIRDMVKRMAVNAYGNPVEITLEEWKQILTEIIAGFEAAERISDFHYPTTYGRDRWRKYHQRDVEIFNHGMNLLKKWWFALWD